MPTLLRLRFWGGHLLMIGAVAATLLLGRWQYDVWQAGRDAAAHDLTDAAPKPLSAVMTGDDPFPGADLGRPVTFEGSWLGKDTVFVQDRLLHGKRGYWVVTPVQVGASAMPVVRGWAAQPSAPAINGSATITGWLQASEADAGPDPRPDDDILLSMRIASMTQRVPVDLYSAYVVDKSATADLRAVTAASVPPVSNFTGLRNLLYAFQWLLFAGFAIYVWGRWCADQLISERADPDADPSPPAQ